MTTLRLSPATRLADPADTVRYGAHRPGPPPLVRFTGRITADGDFTARPFRYHVYGARACPSSHRVAITRELAGLHDLVTMSYVDGERDGRGWAFRAEHGPDPVNGFTLLREAYDATEENFDGHVGVPVLWDRFGTRVASNDARGIALDLATRFRHLAEPPVDTYPAALRDEVDALEDRLDADLRGDLLETFEQLDARLSRRRHLLGDALTQADVRLWVMLVRYDAGPNARRTINPGLHVFPHLWRYARELYALPAFRDTTDFRAFTAPGARLPDWEPYRH
jgi:putative glutathione S-transferase